MFLVGIQLTVRVVPSNRICRSLLWRPPGKKRTLSILFQLTLTVMPNRERQVLVQSHSKRASGTPGVAARLGGVVFLGTPHRWRDSGSAGLEELIVKLGVIGQSLPMMPMLKQSRHILQSVTTSFDEFIRVKGDDVKLWTFFEEEPMPNIGLVRRLVYVLIVVTSFDGLCFKGRGQIRRRSR
jgi:hypothetical protein